MARKYVFKVRFRVNGKSKSFKTVASGSKEAAKRLKTKGAKIISVQRAHAA